MSDPPEAWSEEVPRTSAGSETPKDPRQWKSSLLEAKREEMVGDARARGEAGRDGPVEVRWRIDRRTCSNVDLVWSSSAGDDNV